jgi:hypothetical protein
MEPQIPVTGPSKNDKEMYNLQLMIDTVGILWGRLWGVLFTPRRSHEVSALYGFL